MIQLKTKKSVNNWVEMGDGVKFKLNYPSDVQEEKLQDTLLLSGEGVENKNFVKYQRRYIKYTVKDIQGLELDELLGKEPLVFNGELNDKVWWALVSDIKQCMDIYAKISSELEFTESDKKK